ncbi:hypothetical protein OMAG_002931 [Candidatus Omnitrophus magneticus]|uniref:Uncharacterized protein n=1 Tax=Candidatus Omnitrophus magneticus TaxID=1609969 RepID=A0A0F0CJ73_9BACT|nr:hypothetical protein OMAG_002931 [Candidatus Omnitrophus magneticus]
MYIGNSFDELLVAGRQIMTNKTLLYVDKEVLSGERVPINSDETYSKLVYDILNNDKVVITQDEYMLLEDKTLTLVSKAFEGVDGVTVDDIAQLATAQVQKLSDIVNIGSFELTNISEETIYDIYDRTILSEFIQGVQKTNE